MLKIKRHAISGYVITSTPRNVNVRAADLGQVAQVVKHYFSDGACKAGCPLCAACLKASRKHEKDAGWTGGA